MHINHRRKNPAPCYKYSSHTQNKDTHRRWWMNQRTRKRRRNDKIALRTGQYLKIRNEKPVDWHAIY